jgi:hypothetical protein
VNLDIVLLFVSTVAFLGIWGAKGFREMFFELFFIVGIPLLLVDIYFGFTISVTAHVPYDSMILGGGGLRDGLNKMFFMILAFALVYHLLVAKYGKEIAAMGVRFFGTRRRKESRGQRLLIHPSQAANKAMRSFRPEDYGFDHAKRHRNSLPICFRGHLPQRGFFLQISFARWTSWAW